jgi:hypothetical protein
MDRAPVGRWRLGAVAAGVVAMIALGLRLAGWPAPSAVQSPSPNPSVGLEIHAIVPDVPVVVDADDAEALAEAWLGVPGSATRVDGPVMLPAGAGPHWVVTLADRSQLVVGVLLGNVARTDIAMQVLQPAPIASTRLTIEEARELAFASVGARVEGRDTNASVDTSLIPGKAFWCGKIGGPERRLFACVDLVERRLYAGADADALVAASEEFRNAFFAAKGGLEQATAAYRLVRALGPNDRILGVAVSAPADMEGLAEAAGLETVIGANGPAMLGPWRDVLAVLAAIPATDIILEEDRAAMRPIPAAVGPRPHPGVAYGAWPPAGGTEVAGNGIEMQPEAISAALDSIARSLRPADGQPYDRLNALSLCDTEQSCVVTVWGTLLGAGEDRYDFQLTLGAPIRLIRADYQAVPRPMVQEAERIARNDQATAALIGAYEVLRAVSWNPLGQGRMVITYERTPPGDAPAAAAPVAATSVLVDRLFVTVDTWARRVVSTSEEPAHVPTG